MGLDASVMCNCWRDGLTTPPPFPRESIYVDEDGHLNFRPPAHRDTAEEWSAFYDWTEHACPHPDLELAGEWVGNWAMVRSFQRALSAIGEANFPVLLKAVPGGNDGHVNAQEAALALPELDVFRADCRLQDWVVVETDTDRIVIADLGERVRKCISGLDEPLDLFASKEGIEFLPAERIYPGSLAELAYMGSTAPGETDGLDDEDGAQCVDRKRLKTAFRSARFEQRLLEDGKRAEYRDVESGAVITSRLKLSVTDEVEAGQFRARYPMRMHVRERWRTAADFAHVLGALDRLFRASVESGNPVRWS